MVVWICLSGIPRFLYWKSKLKSIGETIEQVIKLDENTGNAHRCRLVCMSRLLDLNQPLVSKIRLMKESNRLNTNHSPLSALLVAFLVI